MSTLSFDILTRPDFAVLRVSLEQGQRVYAEPSAMASMDANISLKAGFKGGLMRSVGRMFAGESLVMNTFSANAGPGEVMLAPGAAGEVVAYPLQAGSLYLQRGAFLANSEGVDVSAKWEGARGFFAGQGLVLLRATGAGQVFFSTYGAVLEVDVQDGFIVDTGYVVAFEDTLQYDVGVLPGLGLGARTKSFFFGGEGLVVRFSGRGRVWIQTRTINPFLSWVHPFRPVRKRD